MRYNIYEIMNQTLKFMICALGIFIMYFYFGILQEKITRGKYIDGDNTERFTHTLALVFVQCVVNGIYAKIVSVTFMKQGEDTTKTFYYAASSMTYLLAMVCSNMALQWVNYPTQVVGKSCKPIPVMILGVLIGKRSYPWRKYFFIVIISLGVALFIYKDSKPTSTDDATYGMGELLLCLSLTMDGITGAIQERMRAEHKTKSSHMMLSMNLWSTAYLAVALLVTGEGIEFIHFVSRHPSIIWHLATFSVASALGQFFIFLTVSDFGPLPCSVITTTRKFFTVLGSVLLFGNELVTRQWLGTALVFSGIFLDGAYGKSTSPVVAVKTE